MDPFIHELKSQFYLRKQKNPAYSQRAFANSLNVDQSHLSKVIRGVRPPSQNFILSAGQALDLSPKMIRQFLNKSKLPVKTNYFKVEHEYLISNWRHFAILELTKTIYFKPDPNWIAYKLNTPVSEIKDILKRLVALGYLDTSCSPWKVLSPNNSWTNMTSSSSTKKRLQKSLLKKSINSLDETEFKLRENASLTVQCSPEELPIIKQMFLEFRTHVDQYLEETGPHTDVYQMVLGFFPLTKIEEF